MAVWLVTGATGFVGRHVIRRFETATVVALEDKLVVLGRLRPADWPDDAFVGADLNDANQISETIERHRARFRDPYRGANPARGR